jgi:acyl-CoA dehydrogenase
VDLLRSTDKSKGHRGLTAFVILMDAEGVTIEAPGQDGPARDGHLGRGVPGRDRARGEPARRGGRRLQDRDADAGLHASWHGGRAVGVAQAAYELAVDYAKERQFGMPIAMNQGVSPRRRHGDRDRGRATPHLAGRMDDRPGYGRKATSTRRSRSAAADTAMKVTTDAVQVFGGWGYIRVPVELMRDAKLFQIYEAPRRSSGS